MNSKLRETERTRESSNESKYFHLPHLHPHCYGIYFGRKFFLSHSFSLVYWIFSISFSLVLQMNFRRWFTRKYQCHKDVFNWLLQCVSCLFTCQKQKEGEQKNKLPKRWIYNLNQLKNIFLHFSRFKREDDVMYKNVCTKDQDCKGPRRYCTKFGFCHTDRG